MSSPELPFILRGGRDRQSAIFNRINAIERIKYLSGVDLRTRSAAYLRALDMEMWSRWYKDGPANKPIDEEFCQRAAEVVKAMESSPLDLDEEKFNQQVAEHQRRMEKIVNDNQYTQSNGQDAGETKQDAGGVRESGSSGGH